MSCRRPHGPVATASILFALAAALSSAPAPADPALAQAAIARADALWRERAAGHRDGRGKPEPIGSAIAAYEEALAACPECLEARWKLQRALFFLGEYVLTDRDRRLEVFLRGRDLGEEGIEQLARLTETRAARDALTPAERAERLAGQPEAAAIYFWTAAHWGVWGRDRGKLAAARQGVAKVIRDYAETVVAIDPAFEEGGGHRLLGRLHSEAPRVPFFTGWVDRERALSELEAAREVAPGDVATEFFLAEALLDHFPRRRAEGLALLEEVVTWPPSAQNVVEDSKLLEDARRRLARER